MQFTPIRFSNSTPAIIAHITKEESMKILQFIANAFINTMGITKPSPQAERRASWFIVIMLCAVVSTVAVIAAIAIHWASRH
jgi:ABC-type amino acid transport system permease subunit